jgi:hypothetical protein
MATATTLKENAADEADTQAMAAQSQSPIFQPLYQQIKACSKASGSRAS